MLKAHKDKTINMQEADIQQQIKDAYNSLPKVVQETIANADVQAKLRELSKAYSLHLDKWRLLENEIMLALLGITEPQDLPENIVKDVGLTPEQANKITEAVIAIVFDPIQESLKEQVGEAQSTLETIDDTTPAKNPIDISKFSEAPTNPSTYTPKVNSTSKVDDPYHEPIE